MDIRFLKAIIACVITLSVFASCNRKSYFYLEGATMGTYYHIKFEASADNGIQQAIEAKLAEVNNSLSTYIPESTISKVNRAAQPIEVDALFTEVFEAAKEVFQTTHGAFDPTVMPLVNAWGFGFDTLKYVDSLVIDSLMSYIGFDKVQLIEGKLIKDNPNVMLDFSAIAKGFGVDVIAELLESMGVINYMVEIGGEVRVKGQNPKGLDWQVAIEKPIDNKTLSQDYDLVVAISDNSVATSGNYRNYYYRNGSKIAHTINPISGYPIFNDLLSATVVNKKCMMADAYATAFMVLGYDKSIEVAENIEGLMVYFISREEGNDYCTADLLEMIHPVND